MNFLTNIFDALVRARRLQAAYTVAQHLKDTNRDFREVALGDLVNRIMDTENPTHIDGSKA